MSLVKHVVGESPDHLDLIYLLHPSDFLPGDDRMHPRGTLTVAEDPKGTRAQNFQSCVVACLDHGFFQRALSGIIGMAKFTDINQTPQSQSYSTMIFYQERATSPILKKALVTFRFAVNYKDLVIVLKVVQTLISCNM
ncbi:uncharacterized protein MELLADRAFT_112399 [Melampsora larici-populina 98AG31]|uniref:Uncharacterized protein n=1 Tax=Melampsora larici-populina (strain 98AG31 / pathotype 3-4-7) TaxID=747676 RepID=F4S6C8_MELLP|nr:uncharacterized protein MELLADRAFT_112399 [Melampsora larici-populina 98AG31]EGF99788.1 hypothetical protein MELLADRAFT_112399 [Melampsora larici-populina 98AG31]